VIWIKFSLFNGKKNNGSKELLTVNKRLKKAFNTIKEEFEEHLGSINENTNEIQANYEYLCNIDSKIDKLNEKIEEIQLFIKYLANEKNRDDKKKPTHNHIFLTTREKEVFLALYTMAEEKGPITYKAISRRNMLIRRFILILTKSLGICRQRKIWLTLMKAWLRGLFN